MLTAPLEYSPSFTSTAACARPLPTHLPSARCQDQCRKRWPPTHLTHPFQPPQPNPRSSILPLAARCACTDNGEIETIFPLEGDDSRCTLTTGEVAGFDFHRELHRIAPVSNGTKNEGQRICLKLHYVVYPKALAPVGHLLGKMTTYYNQNFRLLFLSTIAPNSLVGRINAAAVLTGTAIFNNIEGVVGWGNLSTLGFIGAASVLANSYNVFFYCTSFLHYLIYLSTYTYRQPHATRIAFGAFKRDALLYKTLALTQAIVQYVTLPPTAFHNQPHLFSLALLAVGFGLATLAALALGVDQTYFGWELGAVQGNFVQRFPYGYIPHPMIMGGMIGWMGFHALPAFRAAHPYYALLHVALYLAHAMQEHASIHSTGLLATSTGKPLAPEAADAIAYPPPATADAAYPSKEATRMAGALPSEQSPGARRATSPRARAASPSRKKTR